MRFSTQRGPARHVMLSLAAAASVAVGAYLPTPVRIPASATVGQQRPAASPAVWPGGTQAAAVQPCRGTAKPAWQHVVWVWMENKGYASVIGSPAAPYINSLAKECGLATNYRGVSHPSLPNYVAATSGSTHGITDDAPPAKHPLAGPSIFSQTGSAGWRSYQESMPGRCNRTATGPLYAVKHNPAAYYTRIGSICQTHDVPLTYPIDLSARFTFVTPNQCSDMHNCSVATGDRWLAGFVPKVLATAQYRSGTTLLFITWDENDGPHHAAGNQVATLIVAPSVRPGARSGTDYTHYSLLRTTEEVLGLPLLGSAASANSLRADFGL